MACWNSHRREWDERPVVEGPVELYRPVEDGTEQLPADANIEVEFHAEYSSIDEAVDAIDCCGRWLISSPDRGQYTGYLNSVMDGVELVIL